MPPPVAGEEHVFEIRLLEEGPEWKLVASRNQFASSIPAAKLDKQSAVEFFARFLEERRAEGFTIISGEHCAHFAKEKRECLIAIENVSVWTIIEGKPHARLDAVEARVRKDCGMLRIDPHWCHGEYYSAHLELLTEHGWKTLETIPTCAREHTFLERRHKTVDGVERLKAYAESLYLGRLSQP